MLLKIIVKIFLISLSLFVFSFFLYKSIIPKNEHVYEPNISSPKTQLLGIETPASTFDLKTSNLQFVLLSFDGSRNLQMWEDTRNFAREMTSERKPVHFTYFISGVYFLPRAKAFLYHPPSFKIGESLIGFADTIDEIPLRIDEVRGAISEGHEIASHLNGHFSGGSAWNETGWISEINQFRTLLSSSGTNSGHPEIIFPDTNKIIGIRTPNLSKNKSLYPALEETGFVYDSSQVGKPTDLPYKIGSIWEIPLKEIPVDGTKISTISMDYNFWSLQSKNLEVAKKNSLLYKKFHDQMYRSYLNYFYQVYQGNRAPVVIGHHFSLWNDGVYWEVMKDFVKEVCGLPDVRCATFSEYVGYLNR